MILGGRIMEKPSNFNITKFTKSDFSQDNLHRQCTT